MPVVVNPYIMEWFLDKSEERHFDTAIDVAVGTALHFAADARRYTQNTTFGWAQSYYSWARDVWDRYPAGEAILFEEDWADNIVRSLMLVGIPLSYVPLMVVTIAPYAGPWAVVTAPVAFALDAYNIYRYFS